MQNDHPDAYMTTHEVAAYLRVRERKIYELVQNDKIPCTRVTGKWLFPRELIDRWLAQGLAGPIAAHPPPPVVAGSHDPLLEWALMESRCELAPMPGGSLDGFARLAARSAVVAGVHILDPDTMSYNRVAIEQRFSGAPLVAVRWATRQQGLVLPPGNPLAVRSLADLPGSGARVVPRQDEAGSQILLEAMLFRGGLGRDEIAFLDHPARSESDLAHMVQTGKAECGVAIETVARQFGLDFVPLQAECYDLVLDRRDYFEPPFQRLLEFTRSEVFRNRAAELAGYDVSDTGAIVYNGP